VSHAVVSDATASDAAASDSAALEPAAAVHTRRELLESALALLGVAALSGFAATRALATEARSSTTWRYFSSGEAATIEALVAQIIPSDDTPGAREMGVARFIDHALADFMAPLAPALRLGLAEFELNCRAQHAGTEGFATLSSEQQIAWLQQVEHTPFFNSVQQLTVLGALSMPDYGGNHNGLGWQLIGFEDLHAFTPPFGYYDRDYPGFDAAAGKS
jgi:gluconate 2-dehydrogenase gamma chain